MKYHFILGEFMSSVVKKQPHSTNSISHSTSMLGKIQHTQICVCVLAAAGFSYNSDFEIESTNFIENVSFDE